MNDEASLLETIGKLGRMAERAAAYGVTLCCKAHVGSAIFNTKTTLQAMAAIANPAFGIDMDPSHVFRAGENPELALPQVLTRTRHIHIRDCRGRGPSPGEPPLQACGRGDIDLLSYFKAMVDGGYDGPVNLEVIGPEQSLTQAVGIASESYGYMNACLKMLGGR
jgi:sugar phosphate isomerase/epimerase